MVLIARNLNETRPKGKKINVRLKKEDLKRAIQQALDAPCKEEHCWVDAPVLRPDVRREVEDAFRPLKPQQWYKNRRTWLNTYDILYVLQQYEELHKDFAFLGVHPIDFQSRFDSGRCVGDDLCSFHIKDLLQKKKKRFGMVLNLDRHNQPGSHWVAVYGSLTPSKPNFGIYYYDSVSNPPSTEVLAFMQQVRSQVREHFPGSVANKFEAKYNTVQKQFKNTECGMFSIVFLTQCLKGKEFAYICDHMHTDDQINMIRDVIYRPRQNT